MELVYLWVEEYKNIHNQGFNFSPKFNCNYDPDTNELTIDENDDYIENFFGDNINVTAIVGKNGSGKSSVLEVINMLTNDQTIDNLNCKYLLLFNNRKYISNIDSIQNDFLNEKVAYKDIYTFTYFAETSSEKKILERNIDINTSKISELLYEFSKWKISIDYSDIFIFNALYIHLTILSSKQLIKKIKKIYFEENMDDIEFETFNYFLIEIEKEKDEQWKQFILNILLGKGLWSLNELEGKSLYEWILEFFYANDAKQLTKDREDFFKNNIINSITEGRVLLQNITSEELEFLLFYKHIFIYDFFDEKRRKYSGLSHGEKTIFSLFLHITKILDDHIGRANCLALFDEVDISLHPYWQKLLIASINKVYSKKSNNIHFLFTTPSPFLLSDIPKQNIIFLDTYKENDNDVKNKKQKIGNCKVLKGDDAIRMKQTFGANIHTLLSDSFFMEDGLMGEFSKGKIQQIMNLLNGNPSSYDYKFRYIFTNVYHFDLMSKNIKKVIDAIGEPFLRDKLLKMHEEKYPQTNEEKIKDLEAEIERIRSGKNQLQS